jgi:streptogramin lyase
MTPKAGGLTRCPAKFVRRLALVAVIIGGMGAPATAHAVSSSKLPPSFVTYPLSDTNPVTSNFTQANSFQLGPDGRWWIPPSVGSTIDRATMAGVDSPLQWGSSLSGPTIIAGSDGNAWMSHFNQNLSASNIDKISPSGTLLATYPLSNFAFGLVLGLDGNIWFSVPPQQGKEPGIERITPAGVTTLFQLPGHNLGQLVNGPDGDFWTTDFGQTGLPPGEIARVTPGGVLTAFPLPPFDGQPADPFSLTVGPDANFWYTDPRAGVIGRITPADVVTQFALPDGFNVTFVGGLAAGPDGNLWFTANGLGNLGNGGPAVGRITPSGQIGLFALPIADQPQGPIAAGPDGRIWLPLASPARLAAFPPFTPSPTSPNIREITPPYSLPAGGGAVTITGYDVGEATQVLFGSTPATSFRALNASQLVATVPPNAVGAVDVSVTTPFGTSAKKAASQFYYQATNCGMAITQTTTLSADIGPCYTGGAAIATDNVTLDLNGHSVTGFQTPRDGSVVGINLQGRTGVTVTNGTVSGFDAGIHVAGGGSNTLSSLSIHDNIGPDDFQTQFGDGIMIEHSASNQIVNNVIDHNGVFDGIGIYDPGSDGTQVVNNVVENTIGTSDQGPIGEGIIINGASGAQLTAIHGTSVLNNVVRNNASGGVANINEIGATIQGNQVEGNGTANSFGNGIGVQVGRSWNLGPTQMVIQRNDVRGNGVDGIRLGTAVGFFNGSPQGNTVTNNVSAGNGTNTAVDFYENGIQAYDLHDLAPNCGTNVWSKNQWGTAGFTPACTSTGGSGPGTTSSAGAPQAAGPNAAAADPTTTFPNAQPWESFLENGRHVS